jgi:shikimate dehydrogenase
MTAISGRTKVFFIVADPVTHVRTPELLNAEFARRGEDAVLVPFHVQPHDLETAFRLARHAENIRGIVVTVPHKALAANHCDAVLGAAVRVGAVNTIRKMPNGAFEGTNFDGTGFVDGLRSAGVTLEGKTVYMAGAGGAAAAIADAVARAGIAGLTIYNRTEGRAEALAQRLRSSLPDMAIKIGSRNPAGHDIVINATSLGLSSKSDRELPFNVDQLGAAATVAEVVMSPEITPLLERARAKGCTIVPGRLMLEAQIRAMAAFLLSH